MATDPSPTISSGPFEPLARVVGAIASLSAFGYFAGWREAMSYYAAIGAPWGASLLSPQALLQLSSTTLVAIATSLFLSFVLLADSRVSLRKLDWGAAVFLFLSFLCLLGSQGLFGAASATSTFVLASAGSILCAVSAGSTLTQLLFSLKQRPGTKLSSGHLWLAYWIVLPGLFWAPERLGDARAKRDISTSSSLPRATLASAPSQQEWRVVYVYGEKALLMQQDTPSTREFKIVDAKDIEFIAQTPVTPASATESSSKSAAAGSEDQKAPASMPAR